MSRLQIRRIIAALALVAALIPALPGRAEAAGYSNVTQSGVAQLWDQFLGWLLGKDGDLPTQAQGHRNGPPETIPPDTDKGSGIDPNGGGGNGNGNGD
jgi:hypothetical protein